MASTVSILKGLLEKKITQEELAKSLGVSLRSIQNYLGGTAPSKKVLRKIEELKNNPTIITEKNEGVMMGRAVQIEAMQRVQLTVLQELFAKALNIPNMEARAIIEKALEQELQKLRQEL